MFSRIIVGADERHAGADAIALARQLAPPHGDISLAYVSTPEHWVYRGVSAQYEKEERVRVTELLEVAKREAGLEGDVHYLASPSVGRGLHEIAERAEADLLVVGSCRRGLVGRVFVGDETHAALNGAPCAVAVAPADYAAEARPIREIGVGYDESPESVHALDLARQLASDLGARLSAFEAISLPRYLLRDGSAPVDATVEDFVNAAQAKIAELGGVEPHAAYGHPAEELALYSASVGLLVVGSRGYGPLGRLVHGSTSQKLARLARCPLLVLTRASRVSETVEVSHDAQATVGQT
jgi:nucleotide-binding universal stress UspA family protein